MTTAICIASGPSLTQEDVDYCHGKGKVYVVNDCHRLAPWADVLYACDDRWWRYHNGATEFKGERWTLDLNASTQFGLNHIGCCEDVWSNDPECIAKGFNSGFQALNLAVIQGATRVVLLGYDMKLGADGKRHWFGEHQSDSLNLDSEYAKWVDHFRKAAKMVPVPVINCTRETALTCFPLMDLRDAL